MTDQTVSVLQLVKRKDADSSDIDSVDLLNLPTELQYQGWNQGLAQTGKPSVDESVTLLMNAGNANTLASSLQSIDTKIKEIGWAQDPLNPIGVWLRSQLSGETGQRQAFILSANRPPRGLAITHPLAYQNVVPDYTLGLTRMPTWENVLAQSITSSPVSGYGGTVSYTVAGDAHARVALAAIRTSQAMNEYWIGVKSGRYGVNPANFVPVWPLYLGVTGLNSDVSTSSDSSAVAGTKTVTTFSANPTMTEIVSLKISDVTANVSDQRGKYMALLRAKVSTGGSLVCNVRVGQGFRIGGVSNSVAVMPRFQITPTANWVTYSLGMVRLPPTDATIDQGFLSACLVVQAEKVSGTGNLEIDSLILIPAEHNIHAKYTLLDNQLSVTNYIQFITRPDKKKNSILYLPTQSAIAEIQMPDESNWSIPSGTGVLVFAASRTDSTGSANTSNTITPTLTVYPSYNSLRGAS